jgi:hypothetical protein
MRRRLYVQKACLGPAGALSPPAAIPEAQQQQQLLLLLLLLLLVLLLRGDRGWGRGGVGGSAVLSAVPLPSPQIELTWPWELGGGRSFERLGDAPVGSALHAAKRAHRVRARKHEAGAFGRVGGPRHPP